MKAVARRREGLHEGFTHDVETDQGHTIVVDEPLDEGGNDAGPSPTRLLAASLASCTAITIEMYADRKGWDLGALEVEVDGERGEGDQPSVFKLVIRTPAELDADQRKQILTVAGKCPVHRVLSGQVIFDDRIEAA